MTGENSGPGAVGRNVIRNVESLRRVRGMTLRTLSARLAEIGRPILPIGLSRLANGQRRVDADDLAAFAVALGVNTNSLLLPRDTPADAEVVLAPEVRTTAWAAWAWADGRMPLPADADASAAPGERFAREVDFARNGRPVFTALDRAKVLLEVYEFADRVEAYLGSDDDLTHRDALRDRVIRQFREVAHKLEDEFKDDDAATAQLREVVRTLPEPTIDYAPKGPDQ
jgi:hypothetical protein